MAAIPKGDRDSVSNEGNDALGLLSRELSAQPSVEYQKNSILSLRMSLQQGDLPAVYRYLVMLEGSRKSDRHAWHLRTFMSIHARIFAV